MIFFSGPEQYWWKTKQNKAKQCGFCKSPVLHNARVMLSSLFSHCIITKEKVLSTLVLPPKRQLEDLGNVYLGTLPRKREGCGSRSREQCGATLAPASWLSCDKNSGDTAQCAGVSPDSSVDGGGKGCGYGLSPIFTHVLGLVKFFASLV